MSDLDTLLDRAIDATDANFDLETEQREHPAPAPWAARASRQRG